MFSAYWEEQNIRRDTGEIPKNETIEIHLDTLGIVNGYIDPLIQQPFYPIYATDNPYGIAAMNSTDRDEGLYEFYQTGGCQDQITACRNLTRMLDNADFGDVDVVNQVCSNANAFCDTIRDRYDQDKSVYILHPHTHTHTLYIVCRDVDEGLVQELL